MGGWSRLLAPRFIEFVRLAAPKRVLDVGCGTGILTRALLDTAPELEGRRRRSDTKLPRICETIRRIASCAFRRRLCGWSPLHRSIFRCDSFASRPQYSIWRGSRGKGTRLPLCKWDFRNGMPMLSLYSQAAEAVAPDVMAQRRAEIQAKPA